MLTLRARSGVPRRTASARARRRPDNLKAAVLDAARKLCFAHGPDGVTARGIAAQVGCSATAIYLYYDSVEHVLHGLRLEGHALLTEYLRRPRAALAAPARLVEMQREYHRFGHEHPNYFGLMFLARLPERPLLEVFRDEGDSLTIVREAVVDGVAAGTVRRDIDPVLVANQVWLAVHGLTAASVSGHLAVTAPGGEAQLLREVQAATAAWLRP